MRKRRKNTTYHIIAVIFRSLRSFADYSAPVDWPDRVLDSMKSSLQKHRHIDDAFSSYMVRSTFSSRSH